MRNSHPTKIFVFFFIFTFAALYSPHLLADNPDTGNLIGFIYKADRTSPLENAIIQLRNITTGTVYESTQSDNFGIIKIEGIERGLYFVGVKTEKGNFNVRNVMGVRTGETAKVSLALEINDGNEKPVGYASILASSEPVINNSKMFLGGTTRDNLVFPMGDEQGDDDQGDDDDDDQGDDDDDDEDNPSPDKPKKPKKLNLNK